MQSLDRGAMAVLLGLAAAGLLSQLGAQQRGLSTGGQSSAAFLAGPPPVWHHATAGAGANAELQPAATLRRVESGPSFTSSTAGAAIAAAALALGAARAVAGRRRTARRATRGHVDRDFPSYWEKYGTEVPYPDKRGFWDGERGYSSLTPPKKDLPGPARQALSEVTEAMAKFVPSQFYTSPAAKLDASGVKEVGSCQISREDSSITVPAQVPEYVRPHKMGIRLEKEKGPLRPPLETDEYVEYINKHSSLAETAKETSAKKGFSLERDFVCDRSALELLLTYLSEGVDEELRKIGQAENPIDFVKITKGPNGKGLMLERVFEHKNLWAERRGYRGGWKRSEISHHGTFSPAWERLASGELDKQHMMITGLRQIAGKRAGETPLSFRFVEYEMGGLKFLTRARTNLTSNGKNVELKHKNYYHQAQVKAVRTYWQMLLGGVGMQSFAFHRSGKIIRVFETTLDAIVAKTPAIVEAAENRMGRLVAMLSQVKEALEKAGGDGPWVLQWQNGELVLGEYKKVEEVEEEKVEEVELELEAA